MVSKKFNKMLYFIFFVLFVLFFGLAFISYRNPKFEFITYLSGSSTFIVAVLTVLYVFTTSKQLDIMSNQLEEMKKDRELQSQPLPYVENIKIIVDKPKFFYTPPEDEYSFHSRYRLKAILNNLSEAAAICIDFSACIIIPTENEKLSLECTLYRIDVMEGKSRLDEGDGINLLYPLDRNGKFFQALRSKGAKTYPRLYIKSFYRNVSGGCFTYTNEYYIIPDVNKDDTIKDWHTQIVSFETKYKDKLSDLRLLRNRRREKWDDLVKEVKDEIACGLIDDVLELEVLAIPGKFNIESMERSDYEKIIENNKYGRFLGVSKR
ncbi:hypothetical protein [Clostridium formicaceticum]|uniref:Uncharacterized protein n=1 Tax=Clostridium formicaceticum TaxID=1497 RepID=A0AAC9WGY4_9CLOT|nr:hypothetical protein [Clostridium formicaceticum]AOY76702.1 hypothetical protein BJL90_12990 [Clostridium formicaceticum]ARE87135.1 hypothetical protein CLFO_15210 [Clostridium formicaceticum]